MKIKYSLGVLVLSGMAVACAPILKSESTTSAAEDDANEIQEFLDVASGIYSFPCTDGTQDTFVYKTDGTVICIARDFPEGDDDCSETPVMVSISETRINAVSAVGADGEYEIDLESGPNYLTAFNSNMTTSVNGYFGEEVLEWGVPALTNGYQDIPEIGAMVYDRVKISQVDGEKSLQVGDRYTNVEIDGSTPEKRPSEFFDWSIPEVTSLQYIGNYVGVYQGKIAGNVCYAFGGGGSMDVLNLILTDFAVQDQRYYSDDECSEPSGNIVHIYEIAESLEGSLSVDADRMDLVGLFHFILARDVDQKATWVDQCGDLDAALTVGESYSADGICGGEPANQAVFTSMYWSGDSVFLASGESEDAPTGDSANDRLDVGLESIEFIPVW